MGLLRLYFTQKNIQLFRTSCHRTITCGVAIPSVPYLCSSSNIQFCTRFKFISLWDKFENFPALKFIGPKPQQDVLTRHCRESSYSFQNKTTYADLTFLFLYKTDKKNQSALNTHKLRMSMVLKITLVLLNYSNCAMKLKRRKRLDM